MDHGHALAVLVAGATEETSAEGLVTANRRQRHRAMQWKAIDRQRLRWYRQGTQLFRARFRAEGKAVVQAFADAQAPQVGIARAVLAIDDQQAAWVTSMTRFYRGVSAEFAPQALTALQTKALPRSLLDWILDEAMVKVTAIGELTKARLRELMETSVEAGETIDDLTHRIEETYEGFATYRAYRIAATETVNAMGASQTLQVSDEGDPEVEKEWLSSRDAATRDTHNVGGLDGQRVKVDEASEIQGWSPRPSSRRWTAWPRAPLTASLTALPGPSSRANPSMTSCATSATRSSWGSIAPFCKPPLPPPGNPFRGLPVHRPQPGGRGRRWGGRWDLGSGASSAPS